MIYWTYLIMAIIFEVLGTTSMKYSEGFSKVVPSILMGLFYILSLVSLTLALKKFEVSMAYAVWSGLGTALITMVGVYLFKESMTTVKLVSIGLIILGVVGLHLSENQTI